MSNERLFAVARALAEAASAPPGPDGRRHLPVLQPRDAAALVGLMHAQLDAAIAHRARDAETLGLAIVCGRGCNACCGLPILLEEGEAVAIATWVKARPDVRARFTAAYARWRAALGDKIEACERAHGAGREARRAAARDYITPRVQCPFNRDGACEIYPVRPGVCRKAHALDTPEPCSDPDGKIGYYSHEGTERTVEAQDATHHIMHASMRGDHVPEALGKAVMRVLGADEVGRNDPCPCGSGAKYKRCCGA